LYSIGRRPDDCTAAIHVERNGAGSQATFDIVDTVSSVASTIAPLQNRLQIPVMKHACALWVRRSFVFHGLDLRSINLKIGAMNQHNQEDRR
jgi:hypothetical protein